MPTDKAKSICQLIWVKPTIENVIPFNQYKRTQPDFNIGEHNNEITQNLLLGGGRELILSLLNVQDNNSNQNGIYGQNNDIINNNNNSNSLDPAELFILNNCIILWFNVLGHGLQIPYSSVLYHACREVNYRNEGHTLEILLTLERDPTLNEFFPQLQPSMGGKNYEFDEFTMKSVELVLTPKYSMYDRYYNTGIENLFTFTNFGINRGDDMVNNCNDALAIGMEIHGEIMDNEDALEEQFMNTNNDSAVYSGMNEILKNHNIYQNSGLADDLDDDTIMNHLTSGDSNEAGMSLEL